MSIGASARNAIVALVLAATASAAQAAVVFTESGMGSLVDGVVGAGADVHMFTIDTPGIYEASIVDLASLDDEFSSAFSKLKLAVKQLGTSGGMFGQAGLSPLAPSFTFEVDHPGSFAALVTSAIRGCGEFGFYEIDITQIAAIPEPGVWLMMLAGLLTLTARYVKVNRGRTALSAL